MYKFVSWELGNAWEVDGDWEGRKIHKEDWPDNGDKHDMQKDNTLLLR